MNEKGVRLLQIALRHFYKQCTDPEAYYEAEGWDQDDAEEANIEASKILDRAYL